VSHTHDNSGEKYCHFRTTAISLGKQVHRGCALRIDKLEIEAIGYSAVQGLAGFDLEAFVSTAALLPQTNECVPPSRWPSVMQQPGGAEVEGRVVIEVAKAALTPEGVTKYSVSYDFSRGSVDAHPALQLVKQQSREDFHVRGEDPKLQVSGWTL
jgi:hypothetical protein